MGTEDRAKHWLGKLTRLNPNQARQMQNEIITKGLAISKSAHWMFECSVQSVTAEPREQDRTTVTDRRYTLRIKQFKEHGPELVRLNSFAGRHLQFDSVAKLRSATELLLNVRRERVK